MLLNKLLLYPHPYVQKSASLENVLRLKCSSPTQEGPSRSRLGWLPPPDPVLGDGKETPDSPRAFVSQYPLLAQQSRTGNATSLLCQPLKRISKDWSTTQLEQTQPRKASNSAGKRRNVLKIPETAGVCFLSKKHPRVLPVSPLWTIKKQFNLHQLFLELVLMDQPNRFSPVDQAGRTCWSSSSPSCPEHHRAGGQRTSCC